MSESLPALNTAVSEWFNMTDEHTGGNPHPLGLYALAAHAAGDFPLQTDRMAAEKFDSDRVRAEHVSVYTTAFLPVALAADWSNRQRAVFLAGIWGTHYAIDTRRWKEPVEGFESFPVWFDQALHIISLAVVFALTVVVGDG